MPLPVVASACSIFLLPNLPPTVSMLGYTGLRVTVPGWMPLLLVVKVTCIVLCCSKGSDSLTGTSHMLISIDDFKDLKRPFFISTVPLQPLMAYNCAEVVHFWSKHWKKRKKKQCRAVKNKTTTNLLLLSCNKSAQATHLSRSSLILSNSFLVSFTFFTSLWQTKKYLNQLLKNLIKASVQNPNLLRCQ